MAPLSAIIRFRRSSAAVCLVLCATMALAAQPSETDVKAAFLPKFARYVTWPAPAVPKGGNPLVLCVIGADPFGDALDAAARNQTVDGRKIVVRHLNSDSGASACHIAYVGGSDGATVGHLLAALRGKPILTVTDASNGPSHGIIHFEIVHGRVRFFIDQADASARGLSISSRLLALAVGVKQK